MTTGFVGTFVIGCEQTVIDGMSSARIGDVTVGSLWRWSGEAVCIDSPGTLLTLGEATGMGALRRRAGRRVRHMMGSALPVGQSALPHQPDFHAHGSIIVTDGIETFAASILRRAGGAMMFIFNNHLPPSDQDLWVVSIISDVDVSVEAQKPRKKMVCFGRGTKISTPSGPRPVETLAPGDYVETLDSGPQPIVWTGFTNVSRQQIEADPKLAPVWIKPGAFGPSTPGDGLFVSQDHKVLVSGSAARALFNTSEVLVPAGELVDDARIRKAIVRRSFRFHHIMLESHQVIWAQGLACESFHPGEVDLLNLRDAQRLALIEAAPDIYQDPSLFGAPARRCLNTAEAAILRFGAPC